MTTLKGPGEAQTYDGKHFTISLSESNFLHPSALSLSMGRVTSTPGHNPGS